MSEPPQDAFVRQARLDFCDVDRMIVDGFNARLMLVDRLKRYKASQGIPFVDLAREQWMYQYLARANSGPLSAEGLAELYSEILDLTKRELARMDKGPGSP